jgi:hypothetical protein
MNGLSTKRELQTAIEEPNPFILEREILTMRWVIGLLGRLESLKSKTGC